MLNGIANNKLATTLRTDKWWIEPLWTGLGFLGFVVYTTWAEFQADHYWWSAGACLVWFLALMVAKIDTCLPGNFYSRRSLIFPHDLLLLSKILLSCLFSLPPCMCRSRCATKKIQGRNCPIGFSKLAPLYPLYRVGVCSGIVI